MLYDIYKILSFETKSTNSKPSINLALSSSKRTAFVYWNFCLLLISIEWPPNVEPNHNDAEYKRLLDYKRESQLLRLYQFVVSLADLKMFVISPTE